MDVLVQNGMAHELFPNGAPKMHSSIQIISGYVGDVKAGWLWDGSTFTAPAPIEKSYKEKRSEEYPPIGDQLDALFHAGVFPSEMAAKIQAVKDKYPKE